MAKVFLRAYNREIESMIDRGHLDEAIAHCHHILKIFPKHLETYRLLGKAYLEAKRYGDAVDIFSRILAAVPSDFVAQVGMSIIRDEENKLDDAIWHMERAFETQPSNAAIQSELQRLYGRRDGVQPPRIRMTRGALAHMYLQGELYPQAISEIKSVLGEDPGRSDMQALLARAYFKSGAKNDAVDAALALLQRHPYSLDANRVLVELLSADRNENAAAYRQRVVELDPYAAQVAGSIFFANEVADAAVTLEHLEWNGEPVGTQSEWRDNKAISLESGAARNEEPDWLKGSFGDVTPPPSQPETGSLFGASDSSSLPPAQPANEIPDFLKAAGWGQATGAFDESKPVFDDASTDASQPLAQGDLPDWIKAMKPPEPEPAEPAEEELPDWINNIGKGALSSAAAETDLATPPGEESPFAASVPSEEPDWMKSFDAESDLAPQPAQTDTPDWLKGINEPEPAASEEPAWLKGFGDAESAPQPVSSETPDWLKGLSDAPEPTPTAASDDLSWLNGIGNESDVAPQPAQSETPDWLKGLGGEAEPAPAASTGDLSWLDEIGTQAEPAPVAQTEDMDWLKQLSSEPAASSNQDFDFLTELTQEPATQTPVEAQPVANTDDLGKSAQEQDDSFAWLEGLAAKQGASEGLLTTPEQRLEQEPEWVRQAKNVAAEPSNAQPPAANLEELGKSAQEQDDSFAWLESLAAKQGASEGLLTKPEERLEQEPEWVRQAKGLTGEPVTPPPAATVEELGKSAQEQDDSFAWLEALAAKQGASEGLLTKPEERLEQEPDWVKQAKSITSEPPAAQPVARVEELGKSAQEQDDSFAWLEGLAAKQGASEGLLTRPEERLQEEPEWVRQAKSVGGEPPVEQPAAQTPVAPQPAANVEELGKSTQEQDDSFAWLESLAAKHGANEGLLTKPEERLEQEPEWVRLAKSVTSEPAVELPAITAPEAEPVVEEVTPTDETPIWLQDLEQEAAGEPVVTQSSDETPAWLKDVEEEERPDVPVSEAAAPVTEQSAEDATPDWLRDIAEDKESVAMPAADETAMWLKSLDQEEKEASAPVPSESADTDMPDWMLTLEQESAPAAESVVPAQEAAPVGETELPSWLNELEKEESVTPPADADDLPAWLRGEEKPVAEKPEPTHATDWKPIEEPKEPEIVYSPPLVDEPQEPKIVYSPPLEETPQPEPEEPVSPVAVEPPQPEPVAPPVQEQPKPRPVRKSPSKPAQAPEPYREPVTRARGTGMLVMPGIDSTLGVARSELSRSNIPGALESYGKLIKKGRFLDEVIYDLREALYRYPVEVSIWQSLGDAYMRANRLQDALDAYTKAEELLR